MPSKKDPHERLLNPFAFPTETTVYFYMLIIAAFLVAWNIGSVFTIGFDSYNNVFFNTLKDTGAKQSDLLGERRFLDLTHAELTELGNEILSYSTTILRVHLPRWIFPFEIVAGMLLLTILLYRLHPKIIRRTFKLQKISEKEKTGPMYGPIIERIEDLCELFQIHQVPDVEIEDKPYEKPSAQVFGFPDSYIFRLKNIHHLNKEKEKYKLSPLIMHELGHIKNGDVELQYYAESAWSSLKYLAISAIVVCFGILIFINFFTNIVLLFFQFSAILTVGWLMKTEMSKSLKHMAIASVVIWLMSLVCIHFSTKSIQFIFQFLAILTAVWLMKAEMLSTQEFYADWHVALHGQRDPYICMMEEHENKTIYKGRWRIIELFKDWIENIYHPTRKRRVEILKNPIELFKNSSLKIPLLNISFLKLPFLTGLLLGIVFVNMSYLIIFFGFIVTLLSELTLWQVVHQLIEHSLPLNHPLFISVFPLFRALIPGLLIMVIFLIGAFLVAGTIGIQAQREVVVDLLDGSSRNLSWIRACWSAIWLTIGLELALWLTPLSPYIPKSPVSFLYTLIWMSVHIFMIFGWLIYVQTLNRIAFRKCTGQKRPKLTSFGLMVIVAMLAWILYLPMFYARFMIQSSHLLPVVSQHLPETINMDFLFTAFLLILSFATFFFSSFFGSILLGGVYILTGHRQPRCPHCNKITRYKTVLGKKCENCQEELTPWLYEEITLIPN